MGKGVLEIDVKEVEIILFVIDFSLKSSICDSLEGKIKIWANKKTPLKYKSYTMLSSMSLHALLFRLSLIYF